MKLVDYWKRKQRRSHELEIKIKSNRHRSRYCGGWIFANKRRDAGCHPLDRATDVFACPYPRWSFRNRVCRHTRTIDFQTHGRQKTLSFKTAHYQRQSGWIGIVEH